MLNETCINCFLTLAQTLNFTKTASLMSFSQQAVSQMILRMENDIGVKLFVRSNHHVSITPAGKEFYEFFSRFKNEYLDLCESMHDPNLPCDFVAGYQNWIDHGVEGKIAIEDIHRTVPQLNITVSRRSPGGLIKGLLEHELDMAIMYNRWVPASGELHITRLMELELTLLVSPNHPLAAEGAVFSDFAHEPFIMDVFETETPAAARRRMKNDIIALNFSPRKLITTNDREEVYTMVEHCEGVAVSTSLSRVSQADNNLLALPTGVKERLVCAWNWTDGNEVLEHYVRCLQNAYRKSGRGISKGAKTKS